MKYMRLQISNEFLIKLFTEGNEFHTRIKQGLPPGTKFKYITGTGGDRELPNTIAGVDIVVENDTWAELKDGDTIPIFESLIIEDLRGQS